LKSKSGRIETALPNLNPSLQEAMSALCSTSRALLEFVSEKKILTPRSWGSLKRGPLLFHPPLQIDPSCVRSLVVDDHIQELENTNRMVVLIMMISSPPFMLRELRNPNLKWN